VWQRSPKEATSFFIIVVVVNGKRKLWRNGNCSHKDELK
jgi:hypothetical protein